MFVVGMILRPFVCLLSNMMRLGRVWLVGLVMTKNANRNVLAMWWIVAIGLRCVGLNGLQVALIYWFSSGGVDGIF